MPKISRITETPQINEKFTLINDVYGDLTLPCWFASQTELSKRFVVKGVVEDQGCSILESNVKVFVNLDASDLSVNNLEKYIAVSINDGQPGDIAEKEIQVNEDGSFEYFISLHLSRADFDDGFFDTPSRVTLKTNTRVSYKKGFIIKSEKHSCYEIDGERVIDLFVHSRLNNNKTWVGLDPGTTGSCICMGTARGGSIYSPTIMPLTEGIIPSCIIIPQDIEPKSRFNDYEPGEDYLYGNVARQYWKSEVNKGSKCFVSIKKLLGYNKKKKIEIIMKEEKKEFSGMEIAHLLIKGIDKESANYFNELTPQTQEQLIGKDGNSAQRIVVAIPNNYTLPKMLDMARSVQELGKYAEVRCIYEPEAILFNYIQKEYSSISSMNNEIVMVFDMGGATINASVYEIAVNETSGKTRIKVSTIGRVGYAVGGDNIDFALIETLIDIYASVSKSGAISDELKQDFEKKEKNDLLDNVFQLKLSLINAYSGNYNGMFMSPVVFLDFLNKMFAGLIKYGFHALDEDLLKIAFNIEHSNTIWEDYRCLIVEGLIHSSFMNEYVYSRIKESVDDLTSACEGKTIQRLIFSGRSVLFPEIKNTVRNQLGMKINEWNGLDDTEIKSAVARGACWYGIYSTSLSLDNELITSSYGFKKIYRGDETFVPVIMSKERFDEYKGNFVASRDVHSGFDEEGNLMEFYQLMGTSNSDAFGSDKKYKRLYLGSVDIDTDTKKVQMSVDRHDRVTYKVEFVNGDVKESDIIETESRDIGDDNDPAYVFATLQAEQQIVEPNMEIENVRSQVQNRKGGYRTRI
jgi:hypothetical protein